VAITRDAHRWLQHYVEQVRSSGTAHRATAKEAVILTHRQRAEITLRLEHYWGRTYTCPAALDLKPQHGYRSRVEKDGFLPEEYIEWIVAGCSDVAEIEAQPNGRPYLLVRDVRDGWATPFDLIVPVTSDAFGYVHLFDVIPKGLAPRK
jgi:hypothetical protein